MACPAFFWGHTFILYDSFLPFSKGMIAKFHFNPDLKKFDKAFIYNMVGQNVQTIENPFQNGNTITLKNDLPKGIYFVKTQLGNSSSTRKLIVN